MILSSTNKTLPEDRELAQKVNEIAEYYSFQIQETENEIVSNGRPDFSEPYEEESTEIFPLTETIEDDKNIDTINVSEKEKENKESEGERKKNFREVINGAPLAPGRPEDPELNALLETLVPEITEGCQDTYDQVKACYDYLVNNCSFSNTEKFTYEQDAYLLLTEFHGSCTYYAAAFHYMMRYIGLNDQLISGYRYLESGRSFHRWNEIIIDNVPYIFDTQWEDTLSRNDDGILYVRFGMTHEEAEEWYEF